MAHLNDPFTQNRRNIWQNLDFENIAWESEGKKLIFEGSCESIVILDYRIFDHCIAAIERLFDWCGWGRGGRSRLQKKIAR